MNELQRTISDWVNNGGNVIISTNGVRANILFTDNVMTANFKASHPIVSGGIVTDNFTNSAISGWVVEGIPTCAIIDDIL